jgi:WD40 repeat protein
MFLRLLSVAFILLSSGSLFAQPEAEQPPIASDESELFKRVVPIFEPGSHTRPICGLGFSSDNSKLITVGEDYSIQIWSAATGHRLDILRLFPYGREDSSNQRDWDVAAISPDGRFVALGGAPLPSQADEPRGARTKLVLIDVVERSVQVIKSPGAGVMALAFSANGHDLAATFMRLPHEIHIFSDLGSKTTGRALRRTTRILKDPDATRSSTLLKFSPDGNGLLSSVESRDLVIWDLKPEQGRIVKRLDTPGQTRSLCWFPEGNRFIHAWSAFRNSHGLEIRSAATGEQEKEFLFTKQAPFNPATMPWFTAFTGPNTLLLNVFDGGADVEPASKAIRFDLKSWSGESLLEEATPSSFPVCGAISSDGQLAAMTTSMGLDAVIYRVKDGSVVARCGAASPIPSVMAWASQKQPPAFAWSEDRKLGRNNTQNTDVRFGFDLTKMEPIGDIRAENFVAGQTTSRDWSIARNKTDPASNSFTVEHNRMFAGHFQGGNGLSSMTLIPQAEGPPLVGWATRWLRTGSADLNLSKADGTLVAKLVPRAVYVRDMAPSPDGRFLVASTGTHRMCVYTTNGVKSPLISVAKVRGEWVAWSAEGYYTASPGGENMIGWAISNGPDKLATFYTAKQFAKHFRRPDLLRRAIELGSLEQALKQVETRAPRIEQILPPKCELKLVKQTGNRVQVQAMATSEIKQKPVIALRVVLDGRPFARGVGQKAVKEGELATATWDLDIPAGSHELKLLARNEDNSAESDSLVIKIPKSANQQPIIYRLCIGVNEYNLPALNLTSAARDAEDVFSAIQQYCVGTQNRFGKAEGALLLNRTATRATVLNEISKIRKSAKPGDLVVILFAGHGVKQQDEYYLLTHEANPNESLKGRSVSGTDLHQALADMECPVLLLLDACHSGSGVKAFRPATDDVTRDLTDESAGVTLLAAAMAHEVASATEENGHYTAAFLKALRAGQGVPFDPYDHVLYTHHIYSVIFSEVRKATQGKQNPSLNQPPAAPPLALREVP